MASPACSASLSLARFFTLFRTRRWRSRSPSSPRPTNDSGPALIITGPDGNLWFTETNVDNIGKITIAGVITEFTPPTLGGAPFVLTAGPDGNLWFTESTAGRIGKITPPLA